MLVDGTLALVNYYANGKITYNFSIKGLVLPKFTVMYYRKLETFIINKKLINPSIEIKNCLHKT